MIYNMPRNVCSRKVTFYIENDRVKDVRFEGGCDGSLKAIAKLIDGMEIGKAIEVLKGIPCNRNRTSCPDQLAKALSTYLK